jgi:hypothetical protein
MSSKYFCVVYLLLVFVVVADVIRTFHSMIVEIQIDGITLHFLESGLKSELCETYTTTLLQI